MANSLKDQTPALLPCIYSQTLFEGLSQESISELARASRIRRVAKGSCLFFQSDTCTAVYLVCKGSIAIQLENPDGRELIINEMFPGECFGELSVLTGEPYSTTAEAVVESEVLAIARTAFVKVLKQEPVLMLRLLEIIARRLQASSRREEALAFQDAQQRLARLLLALDVSTSAKGYLHLSQEELAQRAGLTRQTVADILGRWRRKGWLLTGRGNIMLLNRQELGLISKNQEKSPNFDVMSSR
jgi:CRP/FNR family transcriptional regulator, cyclic AMP receptor protein